MQREVENAERRREYRGKVVIHREDGKARLQTEGWNIQGKGAYRGKARIQRVGENTKRMGECREKTRIQRESENTEMR
jgi:hypothetical protein